LTAHNAAAATLPVIRVSPNVTPVTGRRVILPGEPLADDLSPMQPPASATTSSEGSAAIGSVPTFFDQLWSYTTGAELVRMLFPNEPLDQLDRPILDRSGIVQTMQETPLEPAIRLTVWLQRRLYVHGVDPKAQLETMTALYGDTFARAGAAMLRAFPRRTLFSEEQVFALQRLLLVHGKDEPAEDLTPNERARLLWAALFIPDAFLDPELDADQRLTSMDLADERMLRFFVANGGLASHTAFRHELARAYRLYHVIANSRAARRHRDYCPIDKWLVEAYGLDFVELQTLGFAFFARSNVADRADGELRFTDEDYFSATGLATRYVSALPAIAARREWFVSQFAARDASSRSIARDVQPFLQRPALIQRDGNTVVLGPRPLEAWIGSTGTYYRLLDIARARSRVEFEQFRRFNGFLHERYFRQLTHIAHPYPRRRVVLSGTGRVFSEQTYKVKRVGEQKTSDVAIDLGLDLVLIEITSSRVTTRSLIDGDVKAVVRDLEKVMLANMRQLDRVARDLVSGRAALPDVEIDLVERIWPIIVSPDSLFHSPTLWAWCDKAGGHLLRTPDDQKQRVQRLTLLDGEEYEVLMALVAAGEPLIGILESKTSPLWRERDFKSWFLDRGTEKDNLPFIRQEVARGHRAMLRVLRAGQDAH
jgi:hypothetical protein